MACSDAVLLQILTNVAKTCLNLEFLLIKLLELYSRYQFMCAYTSNGGVHRSEWTEYWEWHRSRMYWNCNKVNLHNFPYKLSSSSQLKLADTFRWYRSTYVGGCWNGFATGRKQEQLINITYRARLSPTSPPLDQAVAECCRLNGHCRAAIDVVVEETHECGASSRGRRRRVPRRPPWEELEQGALGKWKK